MKWNKKDQYIFDCADKGLTALRNIGWLTGKEYDDIQDIISQSIKRKELNTS